MAHGENVIIGDLIRRVRNPQFVHGVVCLEQALFETNLTLRHARSRLISRQW